MQQDNYISSDHNFHSNDTVIIEGINGSKKWYQNGQLHRLDGPAREWYDGSKFWYQNGKLHRLDGPAVERIDGTQEYWISGCKYTESEFKFFSQAILGKNEHS